MEGMLSNYVLLKVSLSPNNTPKETIIFPKDTASQGSLSGSARLQG